ncbi:MAG: hypothetical protein ACUVXJ_02090 [Phycisphaerae bacterium]
MLGYLALGEAACGDYHEDNTYPALPSAIAWRHRADNDSGVPRRPELTGHPIDAFRAHPAVVYGTWHQDSPIQGIGGHSPPDRCQSRAPILVDQAAHKSKARDGPIAVCSDVLVAGVRLLQ